eukprot:CAMPEP_0172897750 /NCGR_PEP_ID=MMETSP1075-20121228/158222_1 /TAXON_ID=2916 /ORGANISM="Ceratium fusus, Strain PA161109" /LENGTH=328 /DNA_ID=CAMNT_0013753409 /DNA_START=547 /DNA_END=1530 /DNA_ORIENTATION=+
MAGMQHAKEVAGSQHAAVHAMVGLAPDELRRLDLLRAAQPGVVFVSSKAHGIGSPIGSSGWVFDGDGHIVTSLSSLGELVHSSNLYVRFADQKQAPVRVVGVDRGCDLAVLEVQQVQVPATPALRPLPRAASGTALVGQDVYVVGNPFGLDHTLTRGMLCASERCLAQEGRVVVQSVLQTDAHIDSRSSGGPVLNSRGEVLGMATVANGRAAGWGLAIPVNMLSSRVESILTHGSSFSRPSLGVFLGPDGLAERLGVSGKGVVIAQVPRYGACYDAGLRAGDVLVAIDGHPVHRLDDVIAALDLHSPGDTVTLLVRRSPDDIDALTGW